MRISRRDLIAGAGGALLAAALPAHAAAEGAVLSGRAFGGAWRIVLADGSRADTLSQPLGALLSAIDRTFSPFRGDSEITRFNRAATTDWQEAGEAFVSVAAEALRIASISAGAFDPSVGPNVGRYGFGPIRGRRTGDFRGFTIGAEMLRKSEPDLTLDLCGIAKGHALDAVAEFLEAEGLPDFLIEIGGEVTARGKAADGRDWRVGVADPLRGGLWASLRADGLAFATSGDAINAYETAGRRYSHMIDPATGEPVRNDVASVTVGARNGATADALATALMVLGYDRGLELAGELDLPALFILRGHGPGASRSTRRFDALRLT